MFSIRSGPIIDQKSKNTEKKTMKKMLTSQLDVFGPRIPTTQPKPSPNQYSLTNQYQTNRTIHSTKPKHLPTQTILPKFPKPTPKSTRSLTLDSVTNAYGSTYGKPAKTTQLQSNVEDEPRRHKADPGDARVTLQDIQLLAFSKEVPRKNTGWNCFKKIQKVLLVFRGKKHNIEEELMEQIGRIKISQMVGFKKIMSNTSVKTH